MGKHTSGRLAFVSARSGAGIGGAEAVLRRMAEGLGARGWHVDLLTSTAESLYTWENEREPGSSTEGDITVVRFPAVAPTIPDRADLDRSILSGQPLSMADQYRWVNAGMRMPDLFAYLSVHAREYDAIVCGPYLFWMCLVLADLAPDRTILLPCLHDEPFAVLDLYRYVFAGARGQWYLSEPEYELAGSLGLAGKQVAVIGSAVDPPPPLDVEGFRSRFRPPEEFVLFAGRREWGKGWPRLVEQLAFAGTVLAEPVPLVTCGVGEVGRVPDGATVIDLGMLPTSERAAAQALAVACIQPSRNESLSRSMLESFQLGTPVIADAGGAVAAWHLARSGAGLTYRDRYELTECLRLVRDAPDLLAAMGKAGPDYVADHFSWPDVLDRAEASLDAWR